jgi:hypothetical protein
MVNYENGKIYKVVCNKTNLIYIGSTCRPLNKRLIDHRQSYRQFLNQNYNNHSIFEIIKNNDYKIELVEQFPCENKQELLKKEREYILSTTCVNKTMPIRHDDDLKNKYKNDIDFRTKCKKRVHEYDIANKRTEYTKLKMRRLRLKWKQEKEKDIKK